MTTLLEPTSAESAPAAPPAGLTQPLTLPPIGEWWPMLESPLRREILERPDAPLRSVVVRRILELCDPDRRVLPRTPIRLGENELAYLTGWSRAAAWA